MRKRQLYQMWVGQRQKLKIYIEKMWTENKQKRKINKTKIYIFKNINITNKSLARLIEKDLENRL